MGRVNGAADPLSGAGDLWVFAYGSLMWRPVFPHAEQRGAVLPGFHRSLCVLSHHHRGTPERPGLVFGLDRGGSCRGVAFRVREADRAASVAYLREREQVTGVYLERLRRVRLDGGGTVEALTYLVDREHPQYAGRLEREAILERVRRAAGVSGINAEYVLATRDRLRILGVRDNTVAWLGEALGVREDGEGSGGPRALPVLPPSPSS